MTREQKTKICEHFDWLHTTASNVPDDLKDVLKAAYLAGAAYALDIYCPHWISVEDELPKIGWTMSDTVVVTDENGGLRLAWYHQDEGWHFATGLPFEPTHWMPLPQAPKKGGEE